jgi:D-sedoheptulose 7-phosphate isomerase
MEFFERYFDTIGACLREANHGDLVTAGELICETRRRGGKAILVGNGGSAAIASHVAVDLTKVCGVRAVNFNEAGFLTCFANDYGYEHWVEKALEFHAVAGDMVILISSSGRSPNIVNGARQAGRQGLAIVTLSGFDADNPLRSLGSLNFWADSHSYNVVESTHLVWLLAIVDHIVAHRGPVRA